MSTAFSKKMQGVETRLLGKYGSTVTLVRAGSKVWDESLGEYVRQPDTQIPLTAVPVPINAGLVNGTTIQVGDMVVKADYSVLPKMEDKVEFSGEQWSVVGIEKKIVNDDIVAWFIQVRK
ncbi:TPA: hypothetical protein LTY94_004565 [Salmonella enterica subsp. enterica serovar Typhimurium]|nr:hypothetical protein [Salmonella enterica subsp. enterica serovar Newport]EEB3074778.1 hypothetical protein [Salmonella enterica subsp. enterica serovar Typhimurium]HBL5117302.1 hypothetical protein [Salmonella enterica subsp. enterica serovar Typhimurium]HBL5549817.1 hypothetical protein [Salmonella enterica subsp. enterica serovar Typhimurium]HBL5554721.1 hypothetical protein [Salmonella enterica subsp. enterica serovar Typhimurium]